MPSIDFKFCQKCPHLRSSYHKVGSRITGFDFCGIAYGDGSDYRHHYLYLYPHIAQHQVEAPKDCAYYAEMFLQDCKKQQEKEQCPSKKS